MPTTLRYRQTRASFNDGDNAIHMQILGTRMAALPSKGAF